LGFLAIATGEFAEDRVRVRVVQILVDGQGLRPRVPGGGQVAGGVVSVAGVRAT
jgi:hypothetical protein